ncbi:MAG: TraM recognition domain-containing protein [Parcubacteria group bacterium]|jgi:hypothetical protein
MSSDLNSILYLVTTLLGFLTLFSGLWLVFRSFAGFRAQINSSMNMDLEIVRVTKKKVETEGQGGEEKWKEEVMMMEKLFSAIASFKQKRSKWKSLIYETPNIIFEIAKPAKSEEILFFMAVPKFFREAMDKQIQNFFPGAVLEKVSDYTIFAPASFTAFSILELKGDPALPLKTYKTMGTDTLDEFANAMSQLDSDEGAVIQIVVVPAEGGEWRVRGKSIAHRMQQGKQLKDAHSNSLAKEIGKGIGQELASNLYGSKSEKDKSPLIHGKEPVQLTPEEQELIKAIEGKANQPVLQINVRALASAKTQERAEQILSYMENAFTQFENPQINTLRVRKRMKGKQVAFDYIFRNFDKESAMLLSAEEVAGIFHFPISVTETPKIKWLKADAAPPPVGIPAQGVLIGFNEFRGVKTDIRLTDSDRRRHFYTIGQTGTGKTTILQEMAKQDAKSGKGFCFIDPHGEAIEDILTAIPKERAEDVVVFNPADVERPFGLNLMEYDPLHPEQKTFVINEMIGIFDQLYDLKATGGPMFEQYMRNAMLLIMDDPESGSTLMEISKVLADEDFRRMKLSKCTNPIVVDFWTKEAEKAGGEAALANMVPYITSKLTTFISNDMMRPIIAQQKSTIDFKDIMNNKKILLVNLSKGRIGEINARLLGMVIVGKILLAALSRVDIPEDQREDFYLYMDEFQNVTTNSIAQILSEARKYRLCLNIAHQFIAQLKEEISKAVFGNVGSMILYRVGPEDAEFLEKQVEPVFSRNDLINVDNHKGFSKILINGVLTKPFNIQGFPPTKGDQNIANALKELSRLKYGRDREIVNREIMERTKMAPAIE